MKTKKKPSHTPDMKRVEDGGFVTSITGRRVPLALVDAAPDLLEAARAIVFEAGLIEATHNQPKHPRAWQNSGERWANLARAAVAKAEGRMVC